MSSRSDKAQKALKDKHHAILRDLVQEPGNKTCADCLAKGPRWASWSLGVFVCIRCAGIHRNLGVHISKVKSVDLDSWNVDQIENVLKWGNKRAAEYYECFLPKDFSRPQGNHAVETFIRNKYEKKLYIKKDGEPDPNPNSMLNRINNTNAVSNEKETKVVTSGRRRERPEKKEEPKSNNRTVMNLAKEKQKEPPNIARLTVQNSPPKSSSMNDLLSLDTPSQPIVNDVKHSASTDDLLNFGAFSSPVSHQPSSVQPNNEVASQQQQPKSIDMFQDMANTNNQAPAKSTKESILSLYATSNQQKMYGIPGGVYMQPTQPQQNGMVGPNQVNMPYGYQQHGGQMNQMVNQMQGVNLNTNPVGIQQQYGFPQQQQQQSYNMQQYNQPAFNSQANFTHSNQQQMYNTYPMNNFNQNMGGNLMNNGSLMSTQNGMMGMQPGIANSMFGSNMNAMSAGNTMNNHLWK